MSSLGDAEVSIVLPVFNAAETLQAAMTSISRQTLLDWDCIVIDDGSSDSSAEIAQQFARRDPRFRVIRTQHAGIVGALNVGLAVSRGRLIARMDGDDLMHRCRLEYQLRMLWEDRDLDVVGCHVRLFPRRALRAGRLDYEKWLNSRLTELDVLHDSFVECPLAHPTWMARRGAFINHGYRDAGWPEDYDLLLRWIRAGLRLGVCPRRLHHWRDGVARLSRTAPAYAQSRIVACKAAHLTEGILRSHRGYALWGYGGTGKGLARALRQLHRVPTVIIEVHPGRLGQRILGAPVLPPSALQRMRGTPIIASVAGATARGEIRSALFAMGFQEWRDYVVAA